MARRPPRRAVHAGAFVVYLVLAVVYFWHAWSTHPATDLQPGGDQWRSVWFFEWTFQSLVHGHDPLFSTAMNYPGGFNLLVNAGTPLLGIVLSPVTWLFGPIAAFNVASTLALCTAAMAAYAFICRVVGWWPAAFAGGLLYGFSPEELIHAGGHLNLSFTALVPLIFLCLYVLVTDRAASPVRWGIALGLLAVGQFFVSSEVLFETALTAAGALVVAAIVGRRHVKDHLERTARGLGCGLAVTAVLLAWPAWFLAKGPAHVNGPVQLASEAYRSDLLGPVVPDDGILIKTSHLASSADHFATIPVENGSYLGIPLIVLLAAGLIWRRRQPVVVVAAVTGCVAFVLSLGGALTIRGPPGTSPSGHAVGRFPLPMAIFERLPVLDNVVPSRFALLVVLMVAVAGARLLEDVYLTLRSRPAGAWPAGAACGALSVVALVPLLPATLVQSIGPNGTPACFTQLAGRLPAGSVAVVFPYPSGTTPQPMLWSAESNIRFEMPGGSIFVPQPPADHVAFSPLLAYSLDTRTAEVLTNLAEGTPPPETPALHGQIRGEWAGWHATSLIAVPSSAADPGAAVQFLGWLAGGRATVDGQCQEWSLRSVSR